MIRWTAGWSIYNSVIVYCKIIIMYCINVTITQGNNKNILYDILTTFTFILFLHARKIF